MLTVVLTVAGLGAVSGVSGTRVCHDVTAENISVTQLRGGLLLSLDEGVTFNSFCGDEVTVLVDGVEANIDLRKTSPVTGELIVEANVCYQHELQVNVLEYTFPTKSTKSSVIEYNPTGKFSVSNNVQSRCTKGFRMV